MGERTKRCFVFGQAGTHFFRGRGGRACGGLFRFSQKRKNIIRLGKGAGTPKTQKTFKNEPHFSRAQASSGRVRQAAGAPAAGPGPEIEKRWNSGPNSHALHRFRPDFLIDLRFAPLPLQRARPNFRISRFLRFPHFPETGLAKSAFFQKIKAAEIMPFITPRPQARKKSGFATPSKQVPLGKWAFGARK